MGYVDRKFAEHEIALLTQIGPRPQTVKTVTFLVIPVRAEACRSAPHRILSQNWVVGGKARTEREERDKRDIARGALVQQGLRRSVNEV